ncbi:streptomycin 6-kinase [Arthrobacter sp. UYP6]|uniref:aminoglycoside phosphotransferase family protein n=1 Tax=Arthrobacter sp. UYP6 TaxID=1756378 RepID=UPI0033992134
MSVPIPQELQRHYARTRAGRDWLAGLPLIVSEALERWELAPNLPHGTDPWHGHGALVLPVASPRGPAVLKAAYPHDEALTEPAALGLWSGHGAVRLYASHSDSGTLLLERLDHRRNLTETDMETALEVWGGLVRKLSLPVADTPDWAGVPSLAERVEQLSDELPADWEDLGRPFQRTLLEAALEVCQTRGIVGRRSSNDVLVHTDLHFGNILYRDVGSPQDRGFVAIDPQAMVGEPEFAAAPMLWNRMDELDADRPKAALRRRLARLCSSAGLDHEVARQWSVLREVANALEYTRTGQRRDAERSVWVAAAIAE